MNLGQRIAAWCKAMGITQLQLAEHLDVGPSAVSMWISETTKPSGKNLDALIEYLAKTPQRFYGPIPKAKAA